MALSSQAGISTGYIYSIHLQRETTRSGHILLLKCSEIIIINKIKNMSQNDYSEPLIRPYNTITRGRFSSVSLQSCVTDLRVQ